jgi:predicted deacetylase
MSANLIDWAPGRPFVVSIHDVAPSSSGQVAHIVEALLPRVGTAMSAAIIPAGFSRGRGTQLAAFVRGNCREIALHGYSHQGNCHCHPLAWLAGNSTEFIGLPPVEILARLQRGQGILREAFGAAASVLLPPAWCPGALTPAMAQRAGCYVLVGLTRLSTPTTKRPLAVYSWDCGRFAALGYAGELLGRLRCHLRAAIPCIVLHPCDIRRKLLGRGLAVIDWLLHNGFAPATFAEIAGAPPDLLSKTKPATAHEIVERDLRHHPGAQ